MPYIALILNGSHVDWLELSSSDTSVAIYEVSEAALEDLMEQGPKTLLDHKEVDTVSHAFIEDGRLTVNHYGTAWKQEKRSRRA